MLMAIVFAVIAGVAEWRSAESAWFWLWLGLAAAFCVTAYLRPRLLKPLTLVWMQVGEVLHRVISPVVIGLIFFFVITPYALVMRLAGRDALLRKFDPSAASYWIPRAAPERGAAGFIDQF